jgi:chromosome segregation protein
MMRLTDLDRLIEGRLAGLKAYEDSIAKLKNENQQNTEALDVLEEDVRVKDRQVTELRAERTTRQAALDQAERILHNTRAELTKTESERSQLEVAIAEKSLRKQNIFDRLMIDWHLTPEQLVAEPPADWGDNGAPELSTAEEVIKELRQKMEELGPVNLVAIEEYQEIEERHAFLVAQEADLSSAKAKLIELIKEIDQKSTEMFKETFEKANENFQAMFTRLFNGGTAQLSLLDGDDILECGIDILARPPGKKPLSVSQLSGGERTMTAVALLFAIYMIKPSPFALLDELDAALDDSNIGRFVGVLKDFLELSQFLIITHNQHTIAGADIVYGVTQEEKGISKIISMRLKRIGVEELREEELPEVAAPPPPSKRKMKRYEEQEDK